jgi:hypothetical protein
MQRLVAPLTVIFWSRSVRCCQRETVAPSADMNADAASFVRRCSSGAPAIKVSDLPIGSAPWGRRSALHFAGSVRLTGWLDHVLMGRHVG